MTVCSLFILSVKQSDTCVINVEVIDVNDEEPGNFEWLPDDDPLRVDEMMKEVRC